MSLIRSQISSFIVLFLFWIILYCSYTVLDITSKPLYTLINVSLQHVKPGQSDLAGDNSKEREKATISNPGEIKIISPLNSTNQRVSKGKKRTRKISTNKSNSSVIMMKEKNSKSSSTERWYAMQTRTKRWRMKRIKTRALPLYFSVMVHVKFTFSYNNRFNKRYAYTCLYLPGKFIFEILHLTIIQIMTVPRNIFKKV